MIFCFVFASIWDGITTALGVASIVSANDPLGYAMCGIAGLVVLGFSVGTKIILSRPGGIYAFMRLLWLGAIIFDFYTSFIGNAKYVILRNKVEVGQTLASLLTHEQIWIVLLLTALISGAPILLGCLNEEVNPPTRST